MGFDAKKFLIFTRGRSGSTAIADELNSCASISCYQEPFRPIAYDPPNRIEKWVEMARQGEMFTYLDGVPNIQIYEIFKRIDADFSPGRYLDRLEEARCKPGVRAIGFKQAAGQLLAYPNAWEEISKRKYFCFILIRRNIFRAALSSSLAVQTNIYNVRELPVRTRIVLDLSLLDRFAAEAIVSNRSIRSTVEQRGLECVEIFYEDYLEDRAGFFKAMFECLDTPYELPSPSTFKKIIPDNLSSIISNVDEVIEWAKMRNLSQFIEGV